MVDLKAALAILKGKLVLGEYGPQTRPFVVLDVDEYDAICKSLETATTKRRVPRESRRQTNTTV